MTRKILEKFSLYLALGGVIAAFSVASPYFLTSSNAMNIGTQSAIISIVAVGQTFVILTAGIDLSVGSVVAASSIILGLLLANGSPIGIGLAAALAMGAGLGLGNGVAVGAGRLPPFIVTLGTMSAARGLALAMNGGRPVSGAYFPERFPGLVTSRIGGVPVLIFYAVVVYLVAYFVLTKWKFGRYVYALGGNREAARLSGIRTMRCEILVYIIGGFLAGLAGFLLTARLNYATPIAGTFYELDSIAATVIGGTSLSGGEGSIIGTAVGALLLGVLRNGLTLLNVNPYYQQIIIGLVIVLAVFVDKLKVRVS